MCVRSMYITASYDRLCYINLPNADDLKIMIEILMYIRIALVSFRLDGMQLHQKMGTPSVLVNYKHIHVPCNQDYFLFAHCKSP